MNPAPYDLTTPPLILAYTKSARRLFLLDYDGSLVPFARQPALAVPGPGLLHTLDQLARQPSDDLYIISGRDHQTLESWFDGVPIGLVAEHGAMIRHRDGQWHTEVLRGSRAWMTEALHIMGAAVRQCAESFVEQKEFSLAWHYRNADPAEAAEIAAQLMERLQPLADSRHLHVLPGHKVIELRVLGINKGVAATKLLAHQPYDFIFCVGDDKTDEDMFSILGNMPQAFTVKVGEGTTLARYRLPAPAAVEALLHTLGLQSAIRVP